MSCGGSMKKMQKGGMVKSIIKPFVKKVVKKITKPTTPKMAVGGTTTKRIIKKSTGGMYGIPQENLGTSGQYGFAKKGGAVKKMKTGGTAKPLIKAKNGKIVKTITPFQNYMKTPGAIASDTSDVFTGNRDGLNPKLDKAYYDTYYAGRKNERRTGNDKVKYDANGKRVYKKGGATKAAKFAALAPPYDKATFADKIAGAKKNASSKKLPKAQKGGYTVTNKDGSPMTTPEGYRPPSVPSYPDFKKLRKTDPRNIAFMQLAKNPEEFDPKDVKKYGPKKPSRRMIREMSKESESAPMQTTPYKKGGATKILPKAQFGAFIKAFSKVVKPVAKRVATTSKKNIPKKIDFRNTKNSMERMMGSKQIQNYFKKSTQRDQLLNLVNKNKN
jgi:hypothetical protein